MPPPECTLPTVAAADAPTLRRRFLQCARPRPRARRAKPLPTNFQRLQIAFARQRHVASRPQSHIAQIQLRSCTIATRAAPPAALGRRVKPRPGAIAARSGDAPRVALSRAVATTSLKSTGWTQNLGQL